MNPDESIAMCSLESFIEFMCSLVIEFNQEIVFLRVYLKGIIEDVYK